MNITIRITIDFKVSTRHHLFFRRRTYAKAIYEGPMELDELRAGETLSLKIFNDIPTELIVRTIRRLPGTDGKQAENLVEFYIRTTSRGFTSEGKTVSHTIPESAQRLRTSIAENLRHYGILMIEDSCKIGPEPSYHSLPSGVGTSRWSDLIHS